MSAGRRRSDAPAAPPSDGSVTRPEKARRSPGPGSQEVSGRGGAAPPPEVWSPLQSWLAARPGRSVTLSALALIALQAALRSYVTFSGWFVIDDFAFTTRAREQSIWSSDYLFEPWNGHLMPGAFAWVHVLANRWPLDYLPVGLSDLAIQALTGWVVFLVLRALFGPRPAILVPLAFYLFSVITLPATLWWAAALNQLPGQLAAAAALWFQLAYLRRGLTRYALAGVAALTVGLLFSEKVLLIVPVVFAMTLLYFTPGPPVARLRRAIAEHRWVWLAYGMVVVPYLVTYLSLVPGQVGTGGSLDLALQAIMIDAAKAILPAVFGGPFGWQQLGTPAIAHPSTAVVVLSLMATVLIVVWSVVRRYRAIFAWVVIGCYVIANATVAGLTRGAVFGPNVVLEYRYSTDVALVIAIFAPLAVIRIVDGPWHWPPQLLAPRGENVGMLGSARPNELALTISLTALLVAGSAVSTIQFSTYWHNDITPRFIATAQSDLRKAGHSVPLADITTPSAAAPPGLQMTWPLSTVLAPLEPRPTFLTAHHYTEALFTVDDTGHVRGAVINGPTNRLGPDQTCGWKVQQRPMVVPLRGSTVTREWVARVGYLASMDAETDVTVGDTTTHVDITAGLNQFYVIGEGPVDQVSFSGLSYGTLCTNDVVVGSVEPLPETHP